jgi:osmotically-inducible protein OsmY
MTTPNASSDVTSDGCPTGYRIRMAAEHRLHASGSGVLRCISCEFADGVLCLEGCVPSNYLKQVAQALASGIEGVRSVNNQIEVASKGRRRTASTSDGAGWRCSGPFPTISGN